MLAKICPRSDPDITHMKYSIDSLKLISNTLKSKTEFSSQSVVYQRAYDYDY